MSSPVQLTSLGGIAKWIDTTVTQTLQNMVSPMVQNATEAILPFVTAFLTISLIWYGWLISTGAIQTPIFTALRKVVNIVIIVSIAGAGGLYQTEIVGVVLDLPSALTQALTSGAATPSEMIDNAANNGAEISTRIQDRSPSFVRDAAKAFAFVIVSIIITVVSALFSALGVVVLVIVKVGVGLLAIVGPLFILALLFDYTKDFLKNWVNQILFYSLFTALFSVLFSMVLGMFGLLQQALLDVTQASEVNIFGILTAVVLFIAASGLMLTQVPSIAMSLTGSRGGVRIPFVK